MTCTKIGSLFFGSVLDIHKVIDVDKISSIWQNIFITLFNLFNVFLKFEFQTFFV